MTRSKNSVASTSIDADNTAKQAETSVQEVINDVSILTLDSESQPESATDSLKNSTTKSGKVKSKKGESKNAAKGKVEKKQKSTRSKKKEKTDNQTTELKDAEAENNKKDEEKSSETKKGRRSFTEHKLTEYFQNLKVSKSKKDTTLDESKNDQPNKSDEGETVEEKVISEAKKDSVKTPQKFTEYFQKLKVSKSKKDTTLDESKHEQPNESDKGEVVEEKDTSKAKKDSAKTPQKSDRRSRHKVKLPSESNYHKVTDYFRVRKSERKYKKDIELEKEMTLQSNILNQVEEGLEVKEFEDKGRGVVTTKKFEKGDFVIEYIGDLIDRPTAEKREIKYSENKNIGCYMYYFKHKDTHYCIDATEESGKLGRLINHSRKGNLVSKILDVGNKPHLVLFAKTDIPAGVEVLYDYGDRNRESVKNHPWLNL